MLHLNDNQLDSVPQSVCGLYSLTELYLSKLVSFSSLPAPNTPPSSYGDPSAGGELCLPFKYNRTHI